MNIVIVLLILFVIGCQPETETTTTTIPSTAPGNAPLKVAFIGDQGIDNNSRAVLELIKNEGADMALHQGDLGYVDDAALWDQHISDVLGPDFPYFASIGNHDLWSAYQPKLQRRLERTTANCTGDLGTASACSYRGLFFILSGVGITDVDHASFIGEVLSKDTSQWRICSWHYNQKEMQVGGKENQAGWQPYEACREGGAIIATAHEHSYHRTLTLTDLPNQVVDTAQHPLVDGVPSNPTTVAVAPGKTFVFVSGLGGWSVRNQQRCLPTTYPYGGEPGCNHLWASIYTSDQNATHGALFCTFNTKETNAYCYFKDIAGRIPDEFTIVGT